LNTHSPGAIRFRTQPFSGWRRRNPGAPSNRLAGDALTGDNDSLRIDLVDGMA
jgi:hypothetical protein